MTETCPKCGESKHPGDRPCHPLEKIRGLRRQLAAALAERDEAWEAIAKGTFDYGVWYRVGVRHPLFAKAKAWKAGQTGGKEGEID